MRSQADRDETTLRIAAGILRFASVVVLVAVVAVVVEVTVGLPDGVGAALFISALALGALWGAVGMARPRQWGVGR